VEVAIRPGILRVDMPLSYQLSLSVLAPKSPSFSNGVWRLVLLAWAASRGTASVTAPYQSSWSGEAILRELQTRLLC
jgi:hypothetical protein